MSLHNRIKEARNRKGLTQTELGALIGVAKTTIAGYERQYEPSAAQLGAIADALDVDVTFLLQDEIRNRHEAHATPDEMEHLVKKYRLLDPYGKEAVDGVLDVESRRCEAVRREQLEQAAAALRSQREEMEAGEEIAPNAAKVIPLFTSAAAAGIASPVLGEDYDDYTLKKDDPKNAIFAVKVQGDSMEPYFPDGSIVFCDKTPMKIGDVGVFILDGGSLLKQWCVDNYSNAYLFSLNRKRADADVTVWASSGQTLTCMGRVITRQHFPLP